MRWVAVALLLLLVVALWALMLRGWRRRGRRQSDLPAPVPLPDRSTAAGDGAGDGAEDGADRGIEGTYVSTTTRGDWLDRVVAHGLGTRSEVVVSATPAGLELRRTGAPSFLVPAGDVLGVRRERGMAGKYVEREGLVVISWRLGPAELDTGLRTRRAEDAARLVAMVEGAARGGDEQG